MTGSWQLIRKLALGLAVFITGLVSCYVIWWNLPLSITRHSDIARGGLVIRNISRYQALHHRLPETTDYSTLEALGLHQTEEVPYLDYVKIDSANYLIAFVGGFDGPYLQWNTKRRHWKESISFFDTD